MMLYCTSYNVDIKPVIVWTVPRVWESDDIQWDDNTGVFENIYAQAFL